MVICIQARALIQPTPLSKYVSKLASQPTAPRLTTRALPITTARRFSQQYRMANLNPSNKEWMCWVPDFPDAYEKRMKVRPEHLKNIQPWVDSRKVVLGGGAMSKQPEEGEPLPLVGSFMLVQADTVEEVKEWLANDIYAKSDVWNLDAAQIWPFKSAFRLPV